MVTIGNLYSLIQSLTKSERRYFTLFCSLQEGGKVYGRLYELIQREKGVSDRVREAFNAAHETAQFDPARKHLYRILMKCLRSYHSQRSVFNRLCALLEDIDILFSKDQIELGFYQVEQAKQLALQYEKFAFYVLVAKLELQHLTRLEFLTLSETELVNRQEKINNLLQRQLFANRHASLYEIMLHRYFQRGQTRSSQENERLNDLLLEELQVSTNKRYYSFESAQLHLHFQATYFLMTGQYEESLKSFESLSQLFADNQMLWADEPIYYAYLIDGILTGLRSSGKPEAMRVFLDQLTAQSTRNPAQYAPFSYMALSHELSLLIHAGQFTEGLALLQRVDQFSATAPVHSRAQLTFYAAVEFGLGNYPAALQHVNQELNTPLFSASHPLYALHRLLNLLIHVELGNADYLEYELKSVERKLKIQRQLHKTEKLLLRFIKSFVKEGWQHYRVVELHSQLRRITNDPHEKQLLYAFDFLSWAEAKRDGVPLAQVIRRKAADRFSALESALST